MIMVAEGVKTTEQQDVLELIGCDVIKGYILSPPVMAERIEQMLG